MDTGHNCIKEICKSIEIRCNNAACNLIVNFEWKKEEADSLKVKFTNQTIVPSTGAIYSWTFGDGSGSSERNAEHRYPHSGMYPVCLKVKIHDTCIREECKNIVVGADCTLQSAFNWKTETGNPKRVFFYNQAIVPATNVKYEWKFGDGTFSDQPDPIHLYEHGGDYEVCLTVKRGEDCKSASCQRIVIRDCDV